MIHALLTVAAWVVVAVFALVLWIGYIRWWMADREDAAAMHFIVVGLLLVGLSIVYLSGGCEAHAAPAPIRDLSGSATASATLATHSFSFTAPLFSASAAYPCSLASTFPAGCVQALVVRARQSPTWVRYHEQMLTSPFYWAVYWPIVRQEATPESTYMPVSDGQVVTLSYSDSAFVTVATRDSAGNWSCPSPTRWR